MMTKRMKLDLQYFAQDDPQDPPADSPKPSDDNPQDLLTE
jgi:hypothetical protein